MWYNQIITMTGGNVFFIVISFLFIEFLIGVFIVKVSSMPIRLKPKKLEEEYEDEIRRWSIVAKDAEHDVLRLKNNFHDIETYLKQRYNNELEAHNITREKHMNLLGVVNHFVTSIVDKPLIENKKNLSVKLPVRIHHKVKTNKDNTYNRTTAEDELKNIDLNFKEN